MPTRLPPGIQKEGPVCLRPASPRYTRHKTGHRIYILGEKAPRSWEVVTKTFKTGGTQVDRVQAGGGKLNGSYPGDAADLFSMTTIRASFERRV